MPPRLTGKRRKKQRRTEAKRKLEEQREDRILNGPQSTFHDTFRSQGIEIVLQADPFANMGRDRIDLEKGVEYQEPDRISDQHAEDGDCRREHAKYKSVFIRHVRLRKLRTRVAYPPPRC